MVKLMLYVMTMTENKLGLNDQIDGYKSQVTDRDKRIKSTS